MKSSLSINTFLIKTLFYSSLLFCIGLSCYAFTYSGPMALSMGGAGLASRDPVGGSFLNPAVVAMAEKNYASVVLSKENLSEDSEENKFSFLVVDSTGEAISKGSLIYNRKEYRSDSTDYRESQWLLNVGKFSKPGMAYGLGLSKQTLLNFQSQKEYVDYNLNFGSLVNLAQNFSLAYVVYNIFTGKDSRQSRAYSLGALYGFQYINVLADVRYQEENVSNNRRLSGMLGFELFLHESWLWRMGYASLGPEARSVYSLGLQWLGPRLGFSYAFESSLQDSAQKTHSIDLRVFF